MDFHELGLNQDLRINRVQNFQMFFHLLEILRRVRHKQTADARIVDNLRTLFRERHLREERKRINLQRGGIPSLFFRRLGDVTVDHLFFNRIDSGFHLLKRNSRRSNDHRIGFHFDPQVRGTADVVERLTEGNGIRGHRDLASGGLFGIVRILRVRVPRAPFRRFGFRKQENVDSLLRRIRLRRIALFCLLTQIAQGNRDFNLLELKTVDNNVFQLVLNGRLADILLDRTVVRRGLSGESDLRRKRGKELPFGFRLVFLFRK